MKLKKIIIILRIITVILLLAVAHLSLKYRFGDCDLCEFSDKEGNSIKASEFATLYGKDCLQKPKDNTLINFSGWGLN